LVDLLGVVDFERLGTLISLLCVVASGWCGNLLRCDCVSYFFQERGLVSLPLP